MCGIAGIISTERRADLRGSASRMIDAIRHRGPDGEDTWIDERESIMLAHTRLSILDLSANGAQPMATPDGRFVISYNGEVFNFLEIRSELSGLGHRFTTDSDTEVVLQAFAQWGTDAFHRFNGMWALAIYETKTERLTLCRDRFGIKPLYYTDRGGAIVFASETAAIAAATDSTLDMDSAHVLRIADFDFSTFSELNTHLSGVKSLPAGSLMVVKDGASEIRRWYRMGKEDVPEAYEEQVEKFRELFFDSCKLRLRSDAPLATCLSGGIDSGSIAATLSNLAKTNVTRGNKFTFTAFNAGFPGAANDERELAGELATSKGFKLHVEEMLEPTPDDLEEAMRACDGPMPTLAFYPIWRLYRCIKQHGVSVTLDGQGADEMLGGYYLGYESLRGAMQMVRPRYLRDLFDTYGSLNQNAPQWIRVAFRRALFDTWCDWKQWVKRPVKKVAEAFRQAPFGPDRIPLPRPTPDAIDESMELSENWFTNTLWQQFYVTPLPYYLHQYDRCSMASGVECRMPFMDYRLVEYVYSLPLQSKVGSGFTKRILRDAMAELLPPEINRNRIKTGFNAPFNDWMFGGLRSWVLDMMATPEFRHLPGIDAAKMRADFEAGNQKTAGERTIWAGIHLAFWLRNHRSQLQHSVGQI